MSKFRGEDTDLKSSGQGRLPLSLPFLEIQIFNFYFECLQTATESEFSAEPELEMKFSRTLGTFVKTSPRHALKGAEGIANIPLLGVQIAR